jgi:thiamine biosynthesis lipoprotein
MKYLLIPFLFFFLLTACDDVSSERKDEVNAELIQGQAQGTTYSIKYTGDQKVTKPEIDSVLRQIDLSLSLWVKESTISQFNGVDSLRVSDPHFISVYYRGKEVHDITDGAFHPMILPLVKAWGFGPAGGELKENMNLDSLKTLVNYSVDVSPDENSQSITFVKRDPIEMDVNGIAQGYSVDVVSAFVEERGVENYMVEIGGEVRAKGVNDTGEYWRIGVDKPSSTLENRTLQGIVTLDDASLATSGSYRKFYEKDGKKYSHTIDPATGMPVDHNLLSATVMAKNCTDADAFATAFMVYGVEKTKTFLDKHADLGLEVYLIYSEEGETKTFMSDGFAGKLEEI